jgi:hypothetical protein
MVIKSVFYCPKKEGNIIDVKKLNKKQLQILFIELIKIKDSGADEREVGIHTIKLLETMIDYI